MNECEELANYKRTLLQSLKEALLKGVALEGFDKDDADDLLDYSLGCPICYVEALLDAIKNGDIHEDRLDAVKHAYACLCEGQEIDAFHALDADSIIAPLQDDLRDTSLMVGDTQHFKDAADRDLRENGIYSDATQWAKDVPCYDAFLVLSKKGTLRIYEDESEAVCEIYGIAHIAKRLRKALKND